MKNQVLSTLIPSLIQNGAKFASFKYENSKGQIATHTLQVGASYKNALKKDLESINSIKYEENEKFDLATFEQAKEEVRKSIAMALDKEEKTAEFENRSNGQKEAFVNLGGGLSIHKEEGVISAFCLEKSKVIHKEGVYPKVNSRPKTIAKRDIEKQLRRGKFKRFNLKEISTAKMSGETIELS